MPIIRDNIGKSLISTENEIREILLRVREAQIAQPDIVNIPSAVLHAWVRCVVFKARQQVEDELRRSFEEFKEEIERSIRRFEEQVK